jgi:DNA-binding HxlR family transcriptional regulator
LYRYAQHCPVARAAEVVTQPWTLLVLRELLCGNELRAGIAEGVPRMSESLLRDIRTQISDRLRERAMTVEVVVGDAPAAGRWWLTLKEPA